MQDKTPWTGEERRADVLMVHRLVSQMDSLHSDVTEIKTAMKDLASAITKLALVEERQTHANVAQERAFTAIASLERKVSELEKDTAMNNRVTNWIFGAIGAAISATAAWFFSRG